MTFMEIFLIMLAVSMAFLAGLMFQSRKKNVDLIKVYRGQIGTIFQMADVFLVTIKALEQSHLDFIATTEANKTGNETATKPVMGEQPE